jgi:hypothetical protein
MTTVGAQPVRIPHPLGKLRQRIGEALADREHDRATDAQDLRGLPVRESGRVPGPVPETRGAGLRGALGKKLAEVVDLEVISAEIFGGYLVPAMRTRRRIKNPTRPSEPSAALLAACVDHHGHQPSYR